MTAPNLYPFHSLLWEYHIWLTPTCSGMLLRHRTSPGDGNMQHCILYLCFLKSFLQHFIAEWLTAPPSELVLHSCKCLMFLSAPGEGLGNIRHLREWGTSCAVGAVICHVERITVCFLTFFQFGENTQWITDGFALGRMCTRCVDIAHFCTKAPWV